jgi:hypothetical protein
VVATSSVKVAVIVDMPEPPYQLVQLFFVCLMVLRTMVLKMPSCDAMLSVGRKADHASLLMRQYAT